MGRCTSIALVVIAGFLTALTPLYSQEEIPAAALSKNKMNYFLAAKDATKKEEFQRSLRMLERNFDLIHGNASIPAVVWELAAINFEKLGRPKMALANLFRAIKNHHRLAHDKNMQSFKTNDSADEIEEQNKGLLSIYFKLARNYLSIAIAGTITDQPTEDQLFASEQAKKYIEICIAQEYREEDAEKMRETLTNWGQERERRQFSKRYFMGVGFASWQDSLTLVNDTQQSETELLATTEGPCIGGGIDASNFYWGWKLEACLAFATANVGENSRNVDYFQQGVGVTALLTSPGIYYRPNSGEVALGLEIPILLRSGDYTAPAGNFSLQQTSLVALGVGTELRWFYQKVDFSGKMTKFLGMPSVFWMGMAHYRF